MCDSIFYLVLHMNKL